MLFGILIIKNFSLDFSRVDNAVLILGMNAGTDANSTPPVLIDGLEIRVYGLGYNVLRIMSGMGGLAYSN